MSQIDDEVGRLQRELAELDEAIPKTAVDGPARANLQEQAGTIAERIDRIERAQAELRELEHVIADLAEESPLRNSLTPRIEALRSELDAMSRGKPSAEVVSSPADEGTKGDEASTSESHAEPTRPVLGFLRSRRSQHMASATVVVGFLLPWFDLLLFQLSGLSLVRLIFALERSASELGALLDVDDSSQMTAPTFAIGVFLLLVLCAAISAMIPRRRMRALVSFLSNLTLLAVFTVWLAAWDPADLANSASVGLFVFLAGVMLGVASGGATTLATHLPIARRRQTGVRAGLLVAAVAIVPWLLIAFDAPRIAGAVTAGLWLIAVILVAVPRELSEAEAATRTPDRSLVLRQWWRDRRRTVLAVTAALALMTALGGGAWRYLSAPVEGPLEVQVIPSSDLTLEDGPPNVTIRSIGESATFVPDDDSGDLTWNRDEPLYIEVSPPWPSYDEHMVETVHLTDLDVGHGARGDVLTIRVTFSEEASHLEVALKDEPALLSSSGNRLSEQQRQALEEEERAARSAAFNQCYEEFLGHYSALDEFQREHDRLMQEHWSEGEALYTTWFERATNILNGLLPPLEAIRSAGPSGTSGVDQAASETLADFNDVVSTWVDVRQAAQSEDDAAWSSTVEDVWRLQQRIANSTANFRAKTRRICSDIS